MDVSITQHPELKLVTLEVVGRRSELSHRVPLAWLELVRRCADLPDRVEPQLFFGAFPESDHASDGAHGVYTYRVGAEVRSFDHVPDGLEPLVVPERRYVTTRVEGSADAIDAAYGRLFAWLQERGLRSDPRAWALERYDERRQRVTPPYARFDYDVLKPLA